MTLPKMTLSSKSTATTYRFQADTYGGWACCTVNDATGELNITSDWGNWSHRWNVQHLGRGKDERVVTLTEFLSDRTSHDYLAGKLCNRDEERAFDGDATLEALREHLREARREWKSSGEVSHDLRRMRLQNEGKWWEVDNDSVLDKDTANRLWEEDFPSLCNEAESYSGDQRAVCDRFVEGFFKIAGAKRVTDEPWNLICTRPSHTYLILKDAILPALSAACGEEHRARTAPSVRECTCLGSCKGAAGLAPGWRCALAGNAPIAEPAAISHGSSVSK